MAVKHENVPIYRDSAFSSTEVYSVIFTRLIYVFIYLFSFLSDFLSDFT